MEHTDNELLEKALKDAEWLVINEALHWEFSGGKNTEMLGIAVKELITIQQRFLDLKINIAKDKLAVDIFNAAKEI